MHLLGKEEEISQGQRHKAWKSALAQSIQLLYEEVTRYTSNP
jgi:hypothetical protein